MRIGTSGEAVRLSRRLAQLAGRPPTELVGGGG